MGTSFTVEAASLWAHGEPAGGAPLEDLIPATIVGIVLIAGLALFGWAHRSGRTALLTRLGGVSERVTGLPDWAALPLAVAGGALLIAVFGFYWDVATHIDDGRDPGPFANPSHWWIIVGLAGVALSGVFSILLGSEETSSSVKIRDGWHAPVGGVLLLVCGGIAVMGFPLDDVWHRLFGQDVTLWSPTHIQMVGGAALSTIAALILIAEGKRAGSYRLGVDLEVLLMGALLIGLSAFQAEFDYSVPQFRLLFHPILLMLTAGIALVAARVRLGPGAALKATLFFLLVRGIVSVLVGPVLGHTTLHMPLYLAEALAVEVVGLKVSTDRQINFGAIAGVAIGTVGLAAEWLWSHVWMTVSWPSSLFPEGAVWGFSAAVAGGVLGGFFGRALLEPGAPRQRVPAAVGAAAGAVALAALVYPFPVDADLRGTATVSLEEVDGRQGRWANARIELSPRDLAEEADWFNVTAWQGGGSVVKEPRRVSEGVYETATPIPIHGEWKALIRLQDGSSIVALPIYLPEDEAIPAEEVPARARVTRDFILDKKIVLREAKEVSSAVTYGASFALLCIFALWAAALGWGLHRLETGERGPKRVTGRKRAPVAT